MSPADRPEEAGSPHGERLIGSERERVDRLMNQCPTCGKKHDSNVRFCPDDGTPLTETAVGSAPTFIPPGSGSQTQALRLPVVVGKRYELQALLGGGGMAQVYRGLDQTLGRDVAVKLINPQLRNEPEFDSRFEREARIASKLSDPYIVVVHDYGIDATYGPYLVMEHLQGQSLRERLRQSGPLPLKAALQVSGQLMLALIHAHDKGIVHRDIKPDNIFLLNQSGVRVHLRILDFGIARIYRDAPGQGEALTVPGSVMGTPRYMSPEQMAGQPADARSDLYSAALVIHESLTGELPYPGGKQLTELCKDATPALQALLEHCLRPNPDDRPASALEVYLRLQDLSKASGILLLPPGAMETLLHLRKESPTDRPEDRTRTFRQVPVVAKGKSKRWLLVLAVFGLTVVAAAVLLGLALTHLNGDTPDARSLHGIEIGMSRDAVMIEAGEVPQHEYHGDPWEVLKQNDQIDALGHVLRPDDLAQADDEGETDILVWPDRKLCVLLEDGKVRAVISRSREVSFRGCRVGADSKKALDAFPSESMSRDEFNIVERSSGSAAKQGVFHRFDTVGFGFEAVDGKVAGLTLYTPRSRD
jgi:tRNA A-37 threonylcarbamoyl transferase component Bud32